MSNSTESRRDLCALGFMTGTSGDGVDGAYLSGDGERIAALGATDTYSYSDAERALIAEARVALNGVTNREEAENHPLARAVAQTITDIHIGLARKIIQRTEILPHVIGFHGQTLLHYPPSRARLASLPAFSVQVGYPAQLCRELGLPVVSRFRDSDVLAGGEGAPLAPAFHQAIAVTLGLEFPVAFVNIGGVANVTVVRSAAGGDMSSFDTGPGCGLLDDWMQQRRKLRFDDDGSLAASGVVSLEIFERMMSSSYFDMLAPKSLDRDQFSLAPLESLSDADGAATLTEVTAATIANALNGDVPRSNQRVQRAIFSGGGASNGYLMKRITELTSAKVAIIDELSSADFPLDARFVEAQAFAHLAIRHSYELPLSWPGTTGVGSAQLGGQLLRT